VVGSILLSVLGLRASNPPGITQIDIYELLTSLPRELVPVFRVLEALGSLWIVGLVGAATLLARRWRLARDLALSGVLAWALSRVLGSDVVGHIGLGASLRTLTHAGVTPSFPLVRLAVVVAVVATAAPYVSRPTRRLGQALVGLSVLAGLYVGTVYPIDLVGGLVAGWVVAAAVHLLFRSPGGRPSSSQLRAVLPGIGIDARFVSLAPEQTAGLTAFLSHDDRGPLLINVIGRDELDAQLMAKTWRALAYREPSAPKQLTRVHQVEHEACMTLLAASAGVRVPKVIFVGQAGPGSGLLVLRPLIGPPLGELEPSAVTDELLAGVWSQVALLHRAGLAHGRLDAVHVVATSDGPGIVSFAGASTGDPTHRRAMDVAELLAATAGIVGGDRAIRVCAATLGTG
jgi:tRNA A-37 threonylcarbamoyl transferase component Bud32